MSSLLIKKLDIFMVITLIIANVLRILPYFISLLSKNHLRYAFFLRLRVLFAFVLI